MVWTYYFKKYGTQKTYTGLLPGGSYTKKFKPGGICIIRIYFLGEADFALASIVLFIQSSYIYAGAVAASGSRPPPMKPFTPLSLK